MLYRTMPKSQDKLSILGFGCMRLPQTGTQIDENAAFNLIDMAIEHGINYFDTAVPYHFGSSEPFLGKALARDGKRSKVYIATKLPPWLTHSVKEMNEMLALQLKNLRTDVIDYYLIHSLNGPTWQTAKEAGAIEFLEKAKHDGLIRFAGFSYHGIREDFLKIVDDWNWDFCQIQYNILDEHNQAGKIGLEYAASKGLGVVIMEPLRGGKLARKPPQKVEAVWNKSPIKRTAAEWALRWVWNHPQVSVVLSGMSTPEQVLENIKTANTAFPNSLTTEESAIIREAAETYRKLMKVACTACQYCMPCPAGVNIPQCFESYNSRYLFEDKGAADVYLIRVGGILGSAGMASQCVKCGSCLKKCPQSIPIPDMLEEVAREFEGPIFKIKLFGGKLLIKAQNLFKKILKKKARHS